MTTILATSNDLRLHSSSLTCMVPVVGGFQGGFEEATPEVGAVYARYGDLYSDVIIVSGFQPTPPSKALQLL